MHPDVCKTGLFCVVRKIPSCSLDSLVRQNDALGCSNNVQQHTHTRVRVCNLVAKCDTKQDNIYKDGSSQQSCKPKTMALCKHLCREANLLFHLYVQQEHVIRTVQTKRRGTNICIGKFHHSFCIILLSAAAVTLLTLPSCSTQNESRQEEP